MGNSDDAVPAKIKYALTVLGSCLGVWFTSWALIKPPNVAEWAMYSGLVGLLASSATFLVLAMLHKGTRSAASDVIGGFSTLVGLSAVALLVWFLGANLYSDAHSAPKVTAMKAEPAEVAARGIINVSVDTEYSGHGDLTYGWQLDGKSLPDSDLKQVQIVAPDKAGLHKVMVVVAGNGLHADKVAVFNVLAPAKSACESQNGKARK